MCYCDFGLESLVFPLEVCCKGTGILLIIYKYHINSMTRAKHMFFPYIEAIHHGGLVPGGVCGCVLMVTQSTLLLLPTQLISDEYLTLPGNLTRGFWKVTCRAYKYCKYKICSWYKGGRYFGGIVCFPYDFMNLEMNHYSESQVHQLHEMRCCVNSFWWADFLPALNTVVFEVILSMFSVLTENGSMKWWIIHLSILVCVWGNEDAVCIMAGPLLSAIEGSARFCISSS